VESLSDLTLALLNSIPREAVFGLPNLYAIDGKARKAALTESGKCEIDVSIFDVATGVTVAKAAVAAKEGEAPVARDLVAAHASRLPPGYFAADAGIACRELAALIARIGHDFLFPVKGNAGKIFDEVKGLSWEDVASWESAEKGHGRWETRETKIIRLNAEETEKQIPSAVFFPQGLIYLEVTRTRINQKTFESSWEKAYFLATENNGAVTTQVSDALIVSPPPGRCDSLLRLRFQEAGRFFRRYA